MSDQAASVSLMEWTATGVAILAALFAGWQAWEARAARKKADSAAADAQAFEKRAIEASERIAAIEEERLAVERAERQRYKNPWQFNPEYARGASGWQFYNGGAEVLKAVTLTFEPDSAGIETLAEIPPEMEPGDAIHLRWSKGLGDPAQAKVRLRWIRPNGEQHSMTESLY